MLADLVFKRGVVVTPGQPDVRITRESSLVGFTPISEQARQWFESNVAYQPSQTMCGTIWCEPRFADDLIAGLTSEGLTIEDSKG